MVAGGAQSLAVVSGPFGQQDFGLRSITPDLTAARAAGITSEGSTMYVGSVRASDDPVIPVVTGGTDLLAPAWDFSGRLWMIDRGPSGAVVSYLRRGRAEEVTVPLVSGRDVKSFLVSRDGSRLVAVVRADGEDEIVVSRLLQTPRARFAKALTARRVDAEDERGLRIRDIAWLSPTSIVVLYRMGGQLFQVRTASVDGAPGSADDLSVTLDGPVKALAGTPEPASRTPMPSRAGRLIDLSGASGGTSTSARASPAWATSGSPQERPAQVAAAPRVPSARPMSWLTAAAADLLLGGRCVGCAEPGRPLCPDCRADLPHEPCPAWPDPVPAGLVAPWACAAYDGGARATSSSVSRSGGCWGWSGRWGRCWPRPPLRPWRRGRSCSCRCRPARPSVRARGHDPTFAITARAAGLLCGRRPRRDRLSDCSTCDQASSTRPGSAPPTAPPTWPGR